VNALVNSQSTYPLIFAIDHNYTFALVNALRSLSKVYTQSANLEVFVIHNNSLTVDDTESLIQSTASNQAIKITIIPTKPLSTNKDSAVNHPVYLRLAIPELFKAYEQVIYLDSDILFNRSPYDLARIKIDSNYMIGACQDVQNPTLISGIAIPGWQTLGLDGSQKYFNSGVLIINTKKWNEAKISEQAIEFVENNPQHIRFFDQDALNYLLHEHWQKLDLTWNYPPMSAILMVPGAKYYAEKSFPIKQILKNENSASILHFVGPTKPWQKDFPECAIKDLYISLTSTRE
jgi:lipopolysaccharide biosynthesis glycosyltransferase